MAMQDTIDRAIAGASLEAIASQINSGNEEVAKAFAQAVDEYNSGNPISNPDYARAFAAITKAYPITPGTMSAEHLGQVYDQFNVDAEPGTGQKIFEGAVKIGMGAIGGAALGSALGGIGAGAGAAGGEEQTTPTTPTDTTDGGGNLWSGIGKVIEGIPGTKEQWQGVVGAGEDRPWWEDIPGTKEQWQGAVGAGAAYAGSQEQQRAAEAAAEKAKMVQPWYETGKSALESQSQLLGLTGTPEQQLAALQSSPGYQFRRQMGEKQLESGLAARGGMGSGKAALSAQQWGQDFASQEYQNRLNQLAGLSSQGYLAGAGLGSELGTAELVKGQARSSGLIGAGEALTGGQIATKTKKPNLNIAGTNSLADLSNYNTGYKLY